MDKVKLKHAKQKDFFFWKISITLNSDFNSFQKGTVRPHLSSVWTMLPGWDTFPMMSVQISQSSTLQKPPSDNRVLATHTRTVWRKKAAHIPQAESFYFQVELNCSNMLLLQFHTQESKCFILTMPEVWLIWKCWRCTLIGRFYTELKKENIFWFLNPGCHRNHNYYSGHSSVSP